MMDDLRTRLWDYAYGLLDEADEDSLRNQIVSDREVARMYARVKLQSDLIAQAARASEKADPLATIPDELRVRPPARSANMRQVLIGAASLALSIALLVFAGGVYWSEESPVRSVAISNQWQRLLEAHPRLLVTGPASIPAGDSVEYEVRLQTLEEAPLPLPLTATLESTQGDTLWQESATTDVDGVRRISLPGDLSVDAAFFKVVVQPQSEASGPGPRAEFATWLRVDRFSAQTLAVDQVAIVNSDTALLRTIDLTADVDPEKWGQRFDFNEGKPPPEALLARDLSRVGWSVVERSKVDNQLAITDAKGMKPTYEAPALGTPQIRQKEAQQHPKKVAASVDDALGTSSLDIDGSTPPAQSPPAPAPQDAAESGLSVQVAAGSARVPDEPTYELEAVGDERLLVEGVYANGQLRKARLVDRPESDATNFFGRYRSQIDGEPADVVVKYFDFSVAPPQMVGTSRPVGSPQLPEAELGATDVPEDLLSDAGIQPLTVELSLDRDGYRPLDPVRLNIRVSNASGDPQPAVLGVRVDAVEPQWADQPIESPQSEVHFVRSNTVLNPVSADLPLVYDNAKEQELRLQSAADHWFRRMQREQRWASWTLVAGSGAGLALLAVAALAKWLPNWPISILAGGLLGFSLITGLVWMGSQRTSVNPGTSDALLTHGVLSQPPPAITDAVSMRWAMNNQDGLHKLAKQAESQFFDAVDSFGVQPPVEGLQRQSTEPLLLPAASQWLAADLPSSPIGGNFRAVPGVETFAYGGFSSYSRDVPGSSAHDGQPMFPSPFDAGRSATVYWHPALPTDVQGQAAATFEIPQGRKSYRVVVGAHSRNSYGSSSLSLPTHLRLREP